jgi:hypothetical protein
MNLKNKPPIFVPDEYRAEIEKLSKAALMDLAWDFALSHSDGPETDIVSAMKTFRQRRDIVLDYRDREG